MKWFKIAAEDQFQGGNRALLKYDVNGCSELIVVFVHGSTYHAMDAVCPHSGGPLHLGPVELIDIEDSTTVSCLRKEALVCPWHHYKFTVDNGKSVDDDIFSVSTYKIKLIDKCVYMEYHNHGILNQVNIFKPPEPKKRELPIVSNIHLNYDSFSLVEWAVMILNTPDPDKKVALTHECASRWFDGEIKAIGASEHVPDRPGRHVGLEFVDRSKTSKLGKGGSVKSRIAILHALANVEQWAIDLAWDIVARYSQHVTITKDGIEECISSQKEFFSDFVRVAKEEATHFTYLVDRLKALGSYFGELPVHDGLWDSAVLTSDSLLSRLAIVHMVHEARGLDVNPSTIEKFRKAEDFESVEKLKQIHRDEITHVAAGQRWFSYICALKGVDRYKTFHDIVKNLFWGSLRPPFNERDRLEAGLDQNYYLPLASIKK